MYRANFANGNSMLLTGQAGQKMYNQQQALQQLTRDPQQPQFRMTGQVQQSQGPLAEPNTVDARASTQPQAERVGTTTVSDPVGAQVTPEQQAATPQQQQSPTPLGYTMKSVDPATGKEVEGEAFQMPDGSIGVYRAPRAGSPGGLTSLGRQTMQQFGDAQVIAAQHGARAQDYQQIGVDLAVQDAEARQAYIEEQKIQTALEMQKQADEEAGLQRKVQGLEASYQKAAEDFRTARVDPNRFAKRAPGGNWMIGLSAALGAFGASLARTPNFAMDYINNRIADDIRSQEAEINVKGRDADNQLANLTRSLGDLKLAKTAYRQLKFEEASLEGQRVAGMFKGQQVANSARLVAEQSAAAGALEGEKRSREFVEHVMKDKLYYRQGSAGSAGGFMRPQLQGAQAVKNFVTEKPKGPEAEAAARAVPAERTNAIAGMANAIDAAGRIEANLRKQGFNENSTFDDPLSGPHDAIQRGVSSVVGGPKVKADNALKADTFELARGLQLAYGKSDNDATMANAQAEGSASAADRLRAAQSTRERAIKGVRQELSTLQPNQQEALLSTMSPEARAAVLGQGQR